MPTIYVCKGELNLLKPPTVKVGPFGDHFYMALVGLLVSTDLTMEKYHKKLDQSIAQTKTQLSNLLGNLKDPSSVQKV
jgi:hypothetical protein